jgi:hypothetical protein
MDGTEGMYMRNLDFSLPSIFKFKRIFHTKRSKLSDEQYDNYQKIKNDLSQSNENFSQIGGNNKGILPEKVKVILDGKKYVFIYEKVDETDVYSLYGDKDYSLCVFINIYEDIAYIENINADHVGCINGTKLLDASIKFLKDNKKLLRINKIKLTDSSHKRCGDNKISFADFYMLTNGYTWYVTHGFIPCNNDDKQDLNKIEICVRNKDILKHKNISEIKNLKTYIAKHEKKYDIKKLNKKIEEMKNDRIIKLFNFLLPKKLELSNEQCQLYFDIYKKIMNDMKIKSLHGQTYIMYL